MRRLLGLEDGPAHRHGLLQAGSPAAESVVELTLSMQTVDAEATLAALRSAQESGNLVMVLSALGLTL